MSVALMDLGELNAQIAHDYHLDSKDRQEEAEWRKEGREVKERPRRLRVPQTVSPGSTIQVSLDDSNQWRNAKVLEAFGDRVTAQITLANGQTITRNNIAHESDPIINTIQYRAIWTDQKAEGGIWKHSDETAQAMAQMDAMRKEHADIKKQLRQLQGLPPEDEPVEDEAPKAAKRSRTTSAADELMKK